VPSWNTIDAGLVNVDQLQSTVDIADGVLSPLVAALDILKSVLNLISVFVFNLPNALSSIVDAAINTIEQMILDLLQNNASLCVHINLHWDPDWKYRKSDGDPDKVKDFVNDSALPFTGTGTDGWLLDVGYSANDTSNPFRPLSDADTEVMGIVVLKGVPADGEIQNLKTLFDLFSDFSPAFQSWLDMKERLENATDDAKALWRMGAAAFDDPIADAVRSIEEVAKDAGGTPVADGDEGTNEPNSTIFVADFLSGTGPGTSGDPLVQVGDVLKFRGDSVFYSITGVNYAASPVELTVDPPILRANLTGVNWQVYRGGIVSLLDNLPTDLRQFKPKPGSLPIWLSVPVAGLLPGIDQILEQLRNTANNLRVGLGQGNALQNLINLLEQKISIIEQAIEELNELLKIALAVLEFFDETSVFVHKADGGVAGWINEAIGGENKPDFGSRGVVVGFTAMALTDGPKNHLESFFDLVGVKFQSFSEAVTSAEQDRQDTWDQYFP
jgi:hypothetical protein